MTENHRPTLPAWHRRSLFARLLKLPPPSHTVAVERDIPVTMPDGARLYTDHYYPQPAGDDQPTILIRTPYGRGREAGLGNGYPLAELPAQRFAERGYHVIVQGARGCLDSEGEFSPHVNEAPDGQATVEWIAQQPWFNGSLGTWGPSYLGYMQWALTSGAEGPPPALKAMVVMVASAENFTVSHPDGAFGLETRLRWSQNMCLQERMHRQSGWQKLRGRFSSKVAKDLEAAFDYLPLQESDTVAAGEPLGSFREILGNDQPDDDFWAARDHRKAVARVAAPVHFVGGWYDYYLRGLLRDYAALRSAGRQPYLTIGPWAHAQPGGMMTGLREAPAWFDTHLKSQESGLRQKPVCIYIMGAGQWREMDEFPPAAQPTRYYLQAGAGLATEPPDSTSEPDRYRYDPADPTPAVGGATLGFKGSGAQDNRDLEARADVLCYTTPPLEQDLEVIGPVRLELYAQSNLAHTDFFGRLCDVDPEGASTNLCDGLFRVEPGQPEGEAGDCLRIEIDMWATAHRFRLGHRLRLQVSSGAHPRWNRNLGAGEPLATGAKMAIAEQVIYHDQDRPSALVLPVIEDKE